MRILISSFLLLAVLGAGAPVWAQPAAATYIWLGTPSEITDGGKLINEGKAEEGIALIRTVMNKQLPRKALVAGHTNLCGGYLTLKRYRKAIRNCDRAIRMGTQLWQAYSNRGAARFALGRSDPAIADYRRAIELNPENENLRANLALIEGDKRIRVH